MNQLKESSQKAYNVRQLCNHLDRFMLEYYFEPYPYRFDFHYRKILVFDAQSDAYLFLTPMEDYKKSFVLSDILPDIYRNVPKLPRCNFNEAKDELHRQLDTFSETAILNGISLVYEYVDEQTNDNEKLFVSTDGCESVQAVMDEIDAANRPFDLLFPQT